jgi:hypothetical protein
MSSVVVALSATTLVSAIVLSGEMSRIGACSCGIDKAAAMAEPAVPVARLTFL